MWYNHIMNVRELIAILNKHDPEANIYIDLGDQLEQPWSFSVKDFNIILAKERVDHELKKVAGRPCKETSNSKKAIVIYVK
jgi:hypothetical protein